MKEEVKALATHRLRRAYESLEEGEVLLREGKLKGAMNRVYYSMFYATSALLATKELGSSKHAGVISLLHKEFVKTGIFPAEYAELLNTAFEQRTRGDYKDFVIMEEERVKELLKGARGFIKKTEETLEDLMRI